MVQIDFGHILWTQLWHAMLGDFPLLQVLEWHINGFHWLQDPPMGEGHFVVISMGELKHFGPMVFGTNVPRLVKKRFTMEAMILVVLSNYDAMVPSKQKQYQFSKGACHPLSCAQLGGRQWSVGWHQSHWSP